MLSRSMNDEDTSHVNDQKSGLGVEGNESSSSLSATGAVSASSMDRNHRIFLHLVPFKIAIPQVNRISPQPPQQQTTTTTDSPYSCNNDQDSNTLFQIQLEIMYAKEMENAKKDHDNSNHNNNNHNNNTTTNTSKRGREEDTDPSTISFLKFRLHCYKSKCFFLQSKYDEMTVREANTRVAKKEQKSAMEINHHKLAKNVWTLTNGKNSVGVGTAHSGHGNGNSGGLLGEGGESTLVNEGASIQEFFTLSIGSMSHDPLQYNHNPNNGSNPNNNTGTVVSSTQNQLVGDGPASRTTTTVMEYRTQFQTKRLHRQNQSALYLKANLEHLKGSTKKSLKLCSEAQNCGVRQRDITSTTPFDHPSFSSQQSQNGGDGGSGSRERFKTYEESQW